MIKMVWVMDVLLDLR